LQTFIPVCNTIDVEIGTDNLQLNSISNLSSILATTTLFVCLYIDVRRGLHRIVTGRSAVLIAVVMWFLLEAMLTPEELRKYSQSEYDFSILCVLVSVASFLVAYHQSRCQFFAAFARRLPMLNHPRVIWLLVLGGMMIGIGSILVYSGFDFLEPFRGLMGARRRWTGLSRGRYGGWGTIVYELQMFLQATVPLAVALLFLKKAGIGSRVVAGLFVTWMFLRQFWSGTRSPMIPMFLSLAAAVFWYATPYQRKMMAAVGVPLALAGGIFWSAIVVAGRNEGKFDAKEVQKINYVGYEMFRELLFIVRATDQGMPLQWGMTYFTQLVNPIPRAIWPGKPVSDAGLILARAYGAVDKHGEPTMTNSPGFIGEAYLNFGFLGLLVIPVIAGVLVRAWDNLLPIAARGLASFIIYAGGVATIFMSGRSFNFSTFYGLCSLFLLIVLFEKLGLIASPNTVLVSEVSRPTLKRGSGVRPVGSR
jgi:oligosaccharide repeat unit polymerase